MYLFLCLSAFLPVSLCLSVYLSLCLFIYLSIYPSPALSPLSFCRRSSILITMILWAAVLKVFNRRINQTIHHHPSICLHIFPPTSVRLPLFYVISHVSKFVFKSLIPFLPLISSCQLSFSLLSLFISLSLFLSTVSLSLSRSLFFSLCLFSQLHFYLPLKNKQRVNEYSLTEYKEANKNVSATHCNLSAL